jgi:hypothetical protein
MVNEERLSKEIDCMFEIMKIANEIKEENERLRADNKRLKSRNEELQGKITKAAMEDKCKRLVAKEDECKNCIKNKFIIELLNIYCRENVEFAKMIADAQFSVNSNCEYKEV